MSLDVEALRESFEAVVERAPDVTTRFYAVLFRKYPSLRPMFGSSTVRQEKMLTQALVAVMDHLEDASWLSQTLRALGAKHVDYGVTDEMYPWVADALCTALAEVLGDAWTPRVENAWIEALGAIASMMIAGAREPVQLSPASSAA